MSVVIHTFEKEVQEALRNATAQGIQRATVFYHRQCRMAVNVANTGVRVSAKSVQEQAAKQLKGKSRGLIKVSATRKFKDGSSEDVTAHYMYDANEFAPKTTKDGKVRKVRSVTIYPYPSQPGEPPRKRTGWGQRHVVWEFVNDPSRGPSGRVGIAKNAMYMLYLELGTRRVKRRPWLVATLRKYLQSIGLLAATGGAQRGAA